MTTTALDTNVLIDVLGADPVFGASSRTALDMCARDGHLIVCAEVVAELAAGSGDSHRIKDLLAAMTIVFLAVDIGTALFAGVHRGSGAIRGRITADYLIAAHAARNADRLLTRDADFRRMNMAGLEVVTPSDLLAGEN